MILISDTIPNPETMMIISKNTSLTFITMSASVGHGRYITIFAWKVGGFYMTIMLLLLILILLLLLLLLLIEFILIFLLTLVWFWYNYILWRKKLYICIFIYICIYICINICTVLWLHFYINSITQFIIFHS